MTILRQIRSRFCTSCRLVRRAAFVAREAGGLQWFECGEHSPSDNTLGVTRVSLEPLDEWFKRNGLEKMDKDLTVDPIRELVAVTAAREEQGANAEKYWKDVLPTTWKGPYPPHWCGAFALWCLRQALGCKWQWEVGKGFLYRLRRLPRGTAPDLGDIAYRDEPYRHHGVVTAVGISSDGQSYVITSDGNSGPSPGEVAEHWREQSWWTCFYSIEPLLKEKRANGMVNLAEGVLSSGEHSGSGLDRLDAWEKSVREKLQEGRKKAR